MNVITLPDELQRRAESAAAERGESVDALVQTALKEFLEDMDDIRLAREVLARVEAGEELTYSHDEVLATLEEEARRGGLPN